MYGNHGLLAETALSSANREGHLEIELNIDQRTFCLSVAWQHLVQRVSQLINTNVGSLNA